MKGKKSIISRLDFVCLALIAIGGFIIGGLGFLSKRGDTETRLPTGAKKADYWHRE